MTQSNFRKTMRALCLLTAMTALSFTASAAPPLIVADDVLTFSGGAISPDNPDVYVIDMGAYENGKTYSITVNRPKGAQANYPVSIEYSWVNDDIDKDIWHYCFSMENDGGIEGKNILEFAAGETQKTLHFVADGEAKLPNSQATVYLFTGLGNRTKAQHQVVKMNFTNPLTVTPAIGTDYPNYFSFRMDPPLASIGSYMFISAGDNYWGHQEVMNNTRLAVTRRSIDHEAYPLTVSDTTVAVKETLLLKPEQPAGTITDQLNFLYKISEDAILTNWPAGPMEEMRSSSAEAEPKPCYVLQADSIVNMKMAANDTIFLSYAVQNNAIAVLEGWPGIEVPPHFGAITAGAQSYNIGETVVLTIPVLNSRLLQKLHPAGEWLEHIDITLDGGLTFIDRENIAFNSGNNTITVTGQAINASGSPRTVTAEVLYSKFDPRMFYGEGEVNESYGWLHELYIYGANVTFTVTTLTAAFQPLTSIDFTVPENSQVNIHTANVAFNPVFNPANATFKTGTWASSDPQVGEISATGVFTPKAYGKTTLTFTSDEFAYRTANGLPANNETLIRTFDIYVVSDYPALNIPYYGDTYWKTNFENPQVLLGHNFEEILWTVDGEVKVEVIHPDSVTYKSVSDAFEITGDMLKEQDAWIGGYNHLLNYKIPFDEQTFPKVPTAVDWRYITGGKDSIFARPYKLITSLPLKQTLGDTVMTCVLRDTFDVHIDLPRDPQVRIISDIPNEAMSGDSLTLQYEVKYLPKYDVFPRRGFQMIWGVTHWMGNSAYEGQHPYKGANFSKYSSIEDVLNRIPGDGIDPANVPDWLKLTDMGGYYNAVVTIGYKVPAPLGGLRPGRYLSDDNYEEFGTNLYIGTSVISTNEVAPWTPQAYNDWKTFKAYTADFAQSGSNAYYRTYASMRHTLAEWDSQGYDQAQIISLIEQGNASSKWDAYEPLENYLKSNSPNRVFDLAYGFTPAQCWGEGTAGLTRAGSNDTIYTKISGSEQNNKLFISLPCSGSSYDYDLILNFPKVQYEKKYTYRSDSIPKGIYRLQFYPKNSLFSINLPVHLTYLNGDSVKVEKDIKVSGGLAPSNTGGYYQHISDYVLYEPSGIIGSINFFQDKNGTLLTGNVVPSELAAGTGIPELKKLETDFWSNSVFNEKYTRDFVVNACDYREADMQVTLIDEDTGEKITAAAHINYVTRDVYSNRTELINAGSAECTDGIVSVPIADVGYQADKLMEVIAEGYHPKYIEYSQLTRETTVNEKGNIVKSRGYINNISYYFRTVPLRKNTNPAAFAKAQLKMMDSSDDFYWNEMKDHIFDLDAQGLYSVLPYSHYYRNEKDGDKREHNAMLNVIVPVKPDWNPQNLKLSVAGSSLLSPSEYTLLEYPGFENKYADVWWKINDVMGFKTVKRPEVVYTNALTKVSSITGLMRSDADPAEYAWNISKEVKANAQVKPGQFDVKNLTQNGGDMGNAKSAMNKMEDMNFSLPDPIPFEFSTRTEGNRYYVKGIVFHNFVNDVPLIGQANTAMEMYGRFQEFDAAFDEMKKAVKIYRPAIKIPRTSTARVFAGIRGYMEGYGEYDPIKGEYSYGLNEGGLAVELSANVYVKVPLGIVNVGVGVDGLVSVGMGMSKPSDEDWKRRVNKAQFDLWLETQLSLNVRADVSAGLDIGIAGVGVGVSGYGGLSNKNKVILKPYLGTSSSDFLTAGGMFEVHAGMDVWAHAYFLFWSKNWRWNIFNADKTWYYPNSDSNPYKKSSALRSISSVYMRSNAQLPGSIITDVAANAYPRYFGDGNSLLFQNLKTPENLNDDRISVYTPGSVSDMLPSATLPAYGFDVASNSSGTTVVAYEQMSDSIRPIADKVSQETYIKTQSGNVDVYAAVKNGSGWQTFQLSDLGRKANEKVSDMAPKIAVSPDGATAAAIWKSGLMKVDTLGAATINGNLLLSRYKNAAWSEPVTLMSTDNLGDYSLAIDGDSIVVAAMKAEKTPSVENPGQYDITGKIRLISVSATDSITFIETGRVGRKPQIARTGNNYYVSFMGSRYLNDTTSLNDMYMLAVQKNGQPVDSLSGFAGMNDKVSFGYKLVGDNTAQSVSDLAIIYNAARMVSEGEVENSLFSAKFGRENGKIFVSQPDTILTLPDDEEQMLISFDGYKQGNTLKTAAVISNQSQGAIVVEKQTTFENRIAVVSETFNLSEMRSGSEFSIDFDVLNSGYLPVRQIEITIDEGATATSVAQLLPGGVLAIQGKYLVVIEQTASVPYIIKATYSDGSTSTASGSLDLSAYMMKVNLLSLKATEEKNTAVVEIINNSATPLTEQHEITVGIYGDIFGETLYPGTALKTFPASGLYDFANKKARVATAAFDIPKVEETTSVYAIAKVVRHTGLRASDGENEEQAEKNYAGIQLFPVANDADNSIEQSIDLGEGWNWISFNVDDYPVSLLEQFKTNTAGYVAQIKAGNSQFLNNSEGNWGGELSSITPQEAYLVKSNSEATLKVQGQAVDPAETLITLAAQNWSWIGYTPQAAAVVEEALAGIPSPQPGDQIKGQEGYSMMSDNQWIGSLDAMEPGRGYMYKSGNTQEVQFSYPAVSAPQGSAPFRSISENKTTYKANIYRYPGTMTVTASLWTGNSEVSDGRYEIAAFSGNECRGSAMLEHIDGFEHGFMAFLMIYGEGNEAIRFRIVDHETGKEYEANEQFGFKTDAIYGAPGELYRISFSVTGINTVDTDMFRLYPNPVEERLYIRYNSEKLNKISITDVNGRVIWFKENFSGESIETGSFKPGVYLLKVQNEEQTGVYKFIKK